MSILARVLLAIAIPAIGLSGEIPPPPPLCATVQRFLDRTPPKVYIDLSCLNGNNSQLRALVAAGLLTRRNQSANCAAPYPPVFQLSNSAANTLYSAVVDSGHLFVTVGYSEVLTAYRCGAHVQYQYRVMLSHDGKYLATLLPKREWPINGSLPRGVTLADAGRPLTEVLGIHYVTNEGWVLDRPKSLSWPGSFPTCLPSTSGGESNPFVTIDNEGGDDEIRARDGATIQWP